MSRRGPLNYIIDAHNVLHQDQELCRYMSEPEAARYQLEMLLAHHPHMHIFYDGGPNREQRRCHRHGLYIDYAGSDEADNRIIYWLQQHPQKRAVVISDDNQLRRRARSLGATYANARDFLSAFRTTTHDSESQRGPLSPAQVDEWMKIFGLSDE